jgi:cytochrome c2
MGRFVRDEKRTYPFTWLTIGGVFAFATFWAVYAELVTRVPWQEHQDAFFDMELEQANQGLTDEQAKWEAAKVAEPLKTQLARLEELEAQMASGDYAKAKVRLAELTAIYGKAEVGKTFGGSDLDETYYYRNLAEYERDAAQVKVRQLYKTTYSAEAPDRVHEPDGFYADPAKPAPIDGESVEIHHLRSEIARMSVHIAALETAAGSSNTPEIVKAIRASLALEKKVRGFVETELKHQQRIDATLLGMAKFRGPEAPKVNEPDRTKRAAAVAKAQAVVCAGEMADTMNCIAWMQLGPVDSEYKELTIGVSKAKRPLLDAQLRKDKAIARAEPKLDLNDPLGSLVGPFQIQQIVTSWMDHKRDVDIQQVDRCHTCHMGVDSNLYTDASISPTFRTHPRREELMKAHPIGEFGCTACHQGQGRATDDLAHSKWILETHHGHERWHYAGDHYWEDPMLPVGQMTKIVIDDLNDTFEVKLAKGKKTTIALDHRDPQGTIDDEHSKDPEVLALASPEERLLKELQTKLQAVVAADAKLAPVFKAVARRLDNRIQLGFELLPGAEPPKKSVKLTISFPKIDLAVMLGFGRTRELQSRDETLFVATHPPRVPIRADNVHAQGTLVDTKKDYAFTPPNGAFGLQVNDHMRNRLIDGLPEIESGCLRCHNDDADLYPRRSHQEYVTAKLAYQHAEAELAADPKAYQAARGTTDLPKVPKNPADAHSLAPTLDQGRSLFRQLNCTGCHLLEGYANNQDAGPQLNDVSAKTDPRWMLTWLRDPRGWRGKTSMPNLWPRPIDPASKIPYPEGSPEYLKWEKERAEETIAIAAYLYEMSDNPSKRGKDATDGTKALKDTIAGYADVEGSDAKQGKRVFEAYGCQGCHATVDKGAEVPDAWRQRSRDIAPTLSNLGNKTNVDWLAYWVEQPNRYWHGTSMPNLRLSRKEAASVAKYLISLEGETPRSITVAEDEVATINDAAKRNAIAPCNRAGGQKMSLVDCGKKVITYRGCYGCHTIDGFDGLAPIGPELTGFAKKDISTLDFGYAITDHHMQTTETFTALKFDSPRIYSRDRIELKMGDYDMSAEEIRGLVTFIKGVVAAVPNTKFDPGARDEYASALEGRRLVNDLNCRACHMIEGRGADIDGWRLAELTADPQRRAPFLDGEGGRVQPEWLFDFLRNPGEHGIRPWLHPQWAYGDDVPADKMALRMPTFNLSPEEWTHIVRYFASWDKQVYPFEVPTVAERSKQEKLWAVSNMNSTQTGNCYSCHYYQEFPVERARGDLKKMAPNMDMVRNRLRPQWVKNWLLRPQNYLPYTAMTAFFASTDRDRDAALWPKENDPHMSVPPKGWQEIIGDDMRKLTNEEHAVLVRDLLFSIPDGAEWPKPGQEASSTIVDPEASATVAEADDEEDVVEQPGG